MRRASSSAGDSFYRHYDNKATIQSDRVQHGSPASQISPDMAALFPENLCLSFRVVTRWIRPVSSKARLL